MSLLLIKVFWIGLFISLSISFVFLGTVGIPLAQSSIEKSVSKTQWYQPSPSEK